MQFIYANYIKSFIALPTIIILVYLVNELHTMNGTSSSSINKHKYRF